MHLFVAGASGALGRLLVPLLVEAGHSVVGATRREAAAQRLRAQGATAVLLDVFDADAVHAALADVRPDVVVHQLTDLSGGSPVDNAAVRVTGTRNLVDAAKAAGVGRIVAQSISWAYEPGDGPAVETTPLDVHAPHPRATSIDGIRALEDAVAEIGQHVVLRYGTFYGPGTWYAPGGTIAAKIAAGEFPAGRGVSSFVHVEDAARAALLALDWPSGPVNVVDDEPAPATEWVPVLAATLGAPAPAVTDGGAGWERGADNTLARTDRGWRPRFATWRSGFAEIARV